MKITHSTPAFLSVLLLAVALGGCQDSARDEGSKIPSAPSTAGQETLIGPDSNSNGIRDSIEAYINANYDGVMRDALFQYAQPAQEILLHANDPTTALRTIREKHRAIECVFSIAGLDAPDATNEISAMIKDSEARSRVYVNATSHADGHIFDTPPVNKLHESCKSGTPAAADE